MWRSDDNLQEYMGSEDQTRVVAPGGKATHYLLSHLAGSCSNISYISNILFDTLEMGTMKDTPTAPTYQPLPGHVPCRRPVTRLSLSSQKDAKRHGLISRRQMRRGAGGV